MHRSKSDVCNQMEWVWQLLEKYVVRELQRGGDASPGDAEQERAFLDLLSESTVTVLVQEPWQGSVRFKTLARYEGPEMLALLQEPEAFLLDRFGGGKFKLNFHRGWHFVATQNFKPEGPPRWREMPEIR
jgi:hypothetical protein